MKKVKVTTKVNNRLGIVMGLCLFSLLTIITAAYRINKTANNYQLNVRTTLKTQQKAAIERANHYLKIFNSKQRIYDLLIGKDENFEPEIAQYAIDQLKVDWKEIALKNANFALTNNPFNSKESIFVMLTVSDEGKFSKEEARYAVDHLQADWNQRALVYAKYKTLSIGEPLPINYKQQLFEELCSPNDDEFTRKEAQYAIDNLQVDWKQVALEKAREDYSYGRYSKENIVEKLSSPEGDKFTKEEAQYAVDHLKERQE